MLLNLCFHMAMTSAVFAGGITLTNYHMVCQAVRWRRGWGGGGGHSKMSDGSLGTELEGAGGKRRTHVNMPQLHC